MDYHTWCTAHQQGTSQWVGSFGRTCRLNQWSNGSPCVTEARPGIAKIAFPGKPYVYLVTLNQRRETADGV